MDLTANQLALFGLGLTAAAMLAGIGGTFAQMLLAHFLGKRAETNGNQKERDRAFVDLEREQLLDSSRWRELLHVIAANTEQRHNENVASLDREARALDGLAAEMRELSSEFRQWRGRQD